MSAPNDVHHTLDRLAAEEQRYKDGHISEREYETRRQEILTGALAAAESRSEKTLEKVNYGATLGSLMPIVSSNLLFNILTLGIYRFWGVTRVRRHMWGRINFKGDNFEYTGSPIELLIGLLIALAILAPLSLLAYFTMYSFATQDEASLILTIYGLLAAFYFLVQIAIFRARRYKLSRTRWRGIRAGQSGSALQYALRSVGGWLVVGLTLGLAYPWRNTLLYRYKYENTWLGNQKFSFDGKAGDLFPRWLLCWFTYFLTLGLALVWYQAAEYRYFASKTRYGNLSFKSEISGGNIFVVYFIYSIVIMVFIVLSNVVSEVIFGVGLDVPLDAADAGGEVAAMSENGFQYGMLIWYAVVVATFGAIYQLFYTHALSERIVNNIQVYGEEDFDAIAQSAEDDARYSEGLADALDIGGL